jgi:hypothetical protein
MNDQYWVNVWQRPDGSVFLGAPRPSRLGSICAARRMCSYDHHHNTLLYRIKVIRHGNVNKQA